MFMHKTKRILSEGVPLFAATLALRLSVFLGGWGWGGGVVVSRFVRKADSVLFGLFAD